MSCAEHCSVFPRARANAGDAWRLDASFRRLESGRCIQVAVIGEAPQQHPTRSASKARPAVLVIEARRGREEHEPRGAFKFKLLDVMVFRQQ